MQRLKLPNRRIESMSNYRAGIERGMLEDSPFIEVSIATLNYQRATMGDVHGVKIYVPITKTKEAKGKHARGDGLSPGTIGQRTRIGEVTKKRRSVIQGIKHGIF
jgi:hypothetical protein